MSTARFAVWLHSFRHSRGESATVVKNICVKISKYRISKSWKLKECLKTQNLEILKYSISNLEMTCRNLKKYRTKNRILKFGNWKFGNRNLDRKISNIERNFSYQKNKFDFKIQKFFSNQMQCDTSCIIWRRTVKQHTTQAEIRMCDRLRINSAIAARYKPAIFPNLIASHQLRRSIVL